MKLRSHLTFEFKVGHDTPPYLKYALLFRATLVSKSYILSCVCFIDSVIVDDCVAWILKKNTKITLLSNRVFVTYGKKMILNKPRENFVRLECSKGCRSIDYALDVSAQFTAIIEGSRHET